MKRLTIDDVAKRAGVSRGTVSAVINQKNTVRPDTRSAVLATMKELHYRPRRSARKFRDVSKELGTIGLLIREVDNPYYMTVALGAMEYARSKGYLVLVASSEGDHKYEEKITQSFSDKDIKGAIIVPVLEGTSEIEHLFRLKTINFPFVLLGNVKGIQANVVDIDSINATKRAVKYLIDNGHSRIIHFAGPEHGTHARERIDGFRRAFSESHFAFNNDMIIPTGARLEDGYRKCIEHFQNRPRDEFPTAIVCFNDLVALGVMAALDEMRIRVPDEISVVGNDDIAFARHIPVQLTTIRAPMLELGRRAAEILIKNIEAPEPLPVQNVVLDSDLVVRKSLKALLQFPVTQVINQ